MKFYHATSTGTNLETLKQFIQQGIRTDIAGRAQGKGFYVWTKKELAIHHALEFLAEATQGYPLLVIVEADLNPQDWDLDYEVHAGLIWQFLYNNFELFKQIPDNAIILDGKPLKVSVCKKNEAFKTIVFVIGFKTKAIGYIEPGEASIADAAVLGPIFNYMQVHFPAQTATAEAEMLKKELHAIKYVGKTPLKITGYEAYVNNKWIDALTLLENK